MTLSNIIQEVKKLSHAERAELLDALIVLDEKDVGLTPAQRHDLRQRLEDYRAGRVKMIPGDEAFAQLRKRS